MNVRWQCSMSLFVALACAAIPNSAQGQDPNAHLYLADAVVGRNISMTTNPAYPVDVSLNGNCIAQGLSLGEIRGPFSVLPGTYSVDVSAANVNSPCGGAVVIGVSMTLGAGSNSLGILALKSGNGLTWMTTSIDLSTVPAGQGRLFVVNTSQDGLVGTLTVGDSGNSPKSASFPGKSVTSLGFWTGLYAGTIYRPGSSTVETGPIRLGIASRSVYLIILAGSTANNSVQFIGPKEIKAVL
jgi:hypothetical protein